MNTPALDTMTAEELKAKLEQDGAKLYDYRAKAEAASDAAKAALDEWMVKPEIKALYDAKDQAITVSEQAETNIRLMLDRYYELTGEKNPLPAFQIRETLTPEYETQKLVEWFTGLMTSLFTLNKPAANAWLKEIADDNGLLPPLGDKHRIPAIIVKKPTTAIINAGLERLAMKPVVIEDTAPVSVPVTVNGVILGSMGAGDGFSLQQAMVASTSAEVAKELKDLDDVGDRLVKLLEQDAHTPEPAYAAPAYDPMGDIPF